MIGPGIARRGFCKHILAAIIDASDGLHVHTHMIGPTMRGLASRFPTISPDLERLFRLPCHIVEIVAP